MRMILAAALAAFLCLGSADSQQFTPAGTTISGATTLATGGTAQNVFGPGEVQFGCAIANPATATDEGGIAAAEEIWVSFVGTAVAASASASVAVAAGSAITCPSGLYTAVSWIAATTGHKISAYKW
jgi:hypothetical protein